MSGTTHVKRFEDDNSTVFEIVNDDGTNAGWVTEFKVNDDGLVPAESEAGTEFREQREADVLARQEEAQAALEPAPESDTVGGD